MVPLTKTHSSTNENKRNQNDALALLEPSLLKYWSDKKKELTDASRRCNDDSDARPKKQRNVPVGDGSKSGSFPIVACNNKDHQSHHERKRITSKSLDGDDTRTHNKLLSLMSLLKGALIVDDTEQNYNTKPNQREVVKERSIFKKLNYNNDIKRPKNKNRLSFVIKSEVKTASEDGRLVIARRHTRRRSRRRNHISCITKQPSLQHCRKETNDERHQEGTPITSKCRDHAISDQGIAREASDGTKLVQTSRRMGICRSPFSCPRDEFNGISSDDTIEHDENYIEGCQKRNTNRHTFNRSKIEDTLEASLSILNNNNNNELTATSSTTQTTMSHPLSARVVRFSTLSIREYPVVEGDHPFCRVGPALELGWKVAYETSNVPIHVFEMLRRHIDTKLDQREVMHLQALGLDDETLRLPRRPTRKDLRMDSTTRCRWLGVKQDPNRQIEP